MTHPAITLQQRAQSPTPAWRLSNGSSVFSYRCGDGRCSNPLERIHGAGAVARKHTRARPHERIWSLVRGEGRNHGAAAVTATERVPLHQLWLEGRFTGQRPADP